MALGALGALGAFGAFGALGAFGAFGALGALVPPPPRLHCIGALRMVISCLVWLVNVIRTNCYESLRLWINTIPQGFP